jgi:hypothetical protein
MTMLVEDQSDPRRFSEIWRTAREKFILVICQARFPNADGRFTHENCAKGLRHACQSEDLDRRKVAEDLTGQVSTLASGQNIKVSTHLIKNVQGNGRERGEFPLPRARFCTCRRHVSIDLALLLGGLG